MTAAADPRKLADIVLEARKWAAELRAQEGLQSTRAGLAPLLDALVSLAEQSEHYKAKWEHAHDMWGKALVDRRREREARESAERALRDAESITYSGLVTRTLQRAESAEAALRAAQAREEELEKALLGWESRDHDGQEPCSIERGAGKTLEVMVSGLTYDQAEAIEDWLAAVLAASPQAGEHTERKAAAEQELCRAADAYVWEPTDETMEALRDARAEWQTAVGLWRLARRQAGEAPGGGLLEQPMRREMGVDAPDFGPVLGEPAGDTLAGSGSTRAERMTTLLNKITAASRPGDDPDHVWIRFPQEVWDELRDLALAGSGTTQGDTLCDHCGRSLGVARNEITPDGSVVSVGVECRDCAEEQAGDHQTQETA